MRSLGSFEGKLGLHVALFLAVTACAKGPPAAGPAERRDIAVTSVADLTATQPKATAPQVTRVSAEDLQREREADEERRRKPHASWTASSPGRWHDALENYTSHVTVQNPKLPRAVGVAFATYVQGMHDRIHPIFANGFLDSLDALPADDPRNDRKLFTRVEIAIARDGHIATMGGLKTSGVTAFDVAVLDSVSRASPFAPPPPPIVSDDGNVYVHWDFHREEPFACSVINTRQFLVPRS